MYYRPKTIAEILPLLGRGNVIAGGTDLMPLIRDNVRPRGDMIDIGGIEELKQIEWLPAPSSGGVSSCRIGAGVKLAELVENKELAEHFPALVQAASVTASPQIRNMATLGGNLLQDRRCIYFNQSAYWRSSFPPCFKTGGNVCHQIPNSPDCCALYYADTTPALYIYEAKIRYLTPTGSHTLPVKDFVENHVRENGITASRNILLESVELPLPAAGERSAFYKTALRTTIDFPLIHFAAALSADRRQLRLTAGAVHRQPIVLTDTQTAWSEAAGELSIDEVTLLAEAELKKKARPVKESEISIGVKKSAYSHVRMVLEKL